MSAVGVGVNLKDSVFLLSISMGLVVLLWISMLWFLIEASVGGGQWLGLLASTSISWSGRCVLTDRWSPGSRILLVLMDISLGCVASGGVAVFVLIVLVCCVVVYPASSGVGGTG